MESPFARRSSKREIKEVGEYRVGQVLGKEAVILIISKEEQVDHRLIIRTSFSLYSGQGSFSTVKLGRHLKTGEKVIYFSDQDSERAII